MEVRLPPDEVEKHGIEPRDGVVLGAHPEDNGSDLAVVLGGDGTALAAMRIFAGRDVPVFSFNFGTIGFLATVETSELEDGIQRVIEGDFDVLSAARARDRGERDARTWP